jgi:hypothetical protein
MEYVLTFLAGMAVSMLILRWAVRRAIDRVVDRLLEQDRLESASEPQGMELRVELDNNVYFCYNKADNAFVCQGNNLTELQQNFRSRFPGTNGVIVEGDDASVSWLKTEMLKSND